MTEAHAPAVRRPPFRPPWARARLPPMAVDGLLVVALYVPAAFLARHDPADQARQLALQAALVLPLLIRRRAPLTAFTLIAAAAYAQWLADLRLPADVALLIALYTVAARCEPRRALLAGAVLETGIVLASVRWSSDGRYLGSLVGLTALALAAGLAGAHTRTRRAYLATLEDRAVRLERERDQRARLAVADERARIARELHDVVSHSLSVMVALADAVDVARPRTPDRPTPDRATSDRATPDPATPDPATPDRDTAVGLARSHAPDRVTVAVRQIADTGRRALTDMRRFLGVLRADEPEASRHPAPGLARLDDLLRRVRAAGLPTRLRLTGDAAAVPAAAQLTVYRLVQEALTNTLGHAPAGARAEVRVCCSADAVTVEVTDDGNGRPVPAATPTRADGHGHGIPGMRERAAAYGGTVEAGPLPTAGWRVFARLDLRPAPPPGPGRGPLPAPSAVPGPTPSVRPATPPYETPSWEGTA
ncbi:sensor histidine kinase [Streptomyces sp. SAJ15]|uniref:sensor histidine kinase n=1 Tax=Streptomyces sp. SAJ15 TaxID=2011095 RepID=UPI001185AA27|nr:histidine kinase [Streptomyces sp. SAJ15]TVL88765.1 two-component sensor histidine kinase [Streptomyces sp. SAJ15]